jgi:hypothetical protein
MQFSTLAFAALLSLASGMYTWRKKEAHNE